MFHVFSIYNFTQGTSFLTILIFIRLVHLQFNQGAGVPRAKYRTYAKSRHDPERKQAIFDAFELCYTAAGPMFEAIGQVPEKLGLLKQMVFGHSAKSFIIKNNKF